MYISQDIDINQIHEGKPKAEALGKKLSQRVDFHSAPFPEFSWSDMTVPCLLH
jgi:hypothetical protein